MTITFCLELDISAVQLLDNVTGGFSQCSRLKCQVSAFQIRSGQILYVMLELQKHSAGRT